MRSLLSLLVLGLSTPVFALDAGTTPAGTGEKGTIALDAMTTPGRHFGIGFYVTDHLSLRPSLGIGYSDYAGVFATYDGLYYGAGLGVRRRVGDRLSFVLDGRYLHTANPVVGSSSFGQFRLDGQNQIVASLGLSFNLR